MNIDDLRGQLANLAGPEPRPTAQARDAVRARVRRTRRRHQMTGALSTVLAAALVVGIIGLGLNGSDGTVQVRTTSPTSTPTASGQCRFGAKVVPPNQVPPEVAKWASGSRRGVIGGGALWTIRAQNGAIHDGSIYRIKIGWWTIPWGIPKITARRLDGPGRAVGHGNEAIDQNGKWVASTIELPSVGCWEITATYKHSTITFRRLVGNPPRPLAIGGCRRVSPTADVCE